MFKRILVPTDFSKSSIAAFKPAEELAKKFGSTVYMLHVAEEIPVYAYQIGLSQKELVDRVIDHAAGQMRKVAKRFRWNRVELLVRMGNVQDEILSVVKEKKIDLVVMGTHGRAGLAHAVVGSIAERIVRHAKCYVMTVKPR